MVHQPYSIVIILVLLIYFTGVTFYPKKNVCKNVYKNGYKRPPKELRDLIVVTVRLKLVTFRFKNKARVISFLSLWKMPNSFRLYG